MVKQLQESLSAGGTSGGSTLGSAISFAMLFPVLALKSSPSASTRSTSRSTTNSLVLPPPLLMGMFLFCFYQLLGNNRMGVGFSALRGWVKEGRRVDQADACRNYDHQGIENIYYEIENSREWCSSKGELSACFRFARKFNQTAALRLQETCHVIQFARGRALKNFRHHVQEY